MEQISDGKYCIYKHVFPDGKIYIGKTKRRPLTRWKSYAYKNQTRIYTAILENGEDDWIDNTEHYYLDYDYTWKLWKRGLGKYLTNIFDSEEAGYLEEYWIDEYDSTDIEKGLNCTTGNDSGFSYTDDARKRNGESKPDYNGEHNPFFGKSHSEETRNVISNKHKQRIKETGIVNFKGQHHSDNTKMIIGQKAKERIAKTGKVSFKGSHHNETTRQYLSLIRSVPVTQYTLDGQRVKQYDSGMEAAKTVGVSLSALSACVMRRTHSCAGYIWRREDVSKLSEDEIKHTHGNAKTVIQFDLNGNVLREYNSVREAATENNVSFHVIYGAISNEKIVLNSRWSYKNKKATRCKAVVQMDKDGNLIGKYSSIREAAQALNCSPKSISAATRGVRDTAYGYVWKYLEEI